MKNKVLINVYVPALDEKYELFISVNESINKNLELIIILLEWWLITIIKFHNIIH